MFRSLSTMGRISALLAVGATALVAQGTQVAHVNGEVTTRDGAPVVGVTVRLTSPALQGTRVVSTDAKGRFVARLLPPGTYTIILNKDGMQQLKATTSIGMGTTFEPRYQMAPVGGAVVEVVSSAGEIDKTDVKTATNYTLDKVDMLPNARSLEGVALLTPGVTAGVGGRVQIRGAMTSGNLYLLDGQNISDNSYNDRGVSLIDDSIDEVQVITGAISAEYGDVDGGVVNAITRSGGNEFSGQLRWELANPAWNAVAPYEKAGLNVLGDTKTLSLSGYLIKDKLWFAGSYFTMDRNTTGAIGVNLPAYNLYNGGTAGHPGAAWGWVYPGTTDPYYTGNSTADQGGYGANYNSSRAEIRRQIKLTWAINQEHTLVGSFNNSESNDGNRNYSAGETRCLVPQVSTSSFANLQWRAVWSNTITSEFKIGQKKQKLSAGADAANGSPIYRYGGGGYFNNGIFNNNDGGDNRDNKTANAKVSYFLEAMGSHQFDAGMDYYQGIHKARNEQTATGFIFGVKYIDLANRFAYPQDVWEFTSTAGEAKVNTYGLYLNDKWTLNRNISFNIGVRYDKFDAKKEDGSKSAGASGWSPRLGMKYDVTTEGKYVFGFSFARYNAKAAESVLNSVTGQGNPTEVDHPWVGPTGWVDGPVSFADITDLSKVRTNYDFNTIAYYNNPAVNVKLAGDLKAPSVDEVQGSFQYAFNNPDIGAGSLKLTGVYKKWKNLFDYRVGNDGGIDLPGNNFAYYSVWENSSIAERKYKGLELEGAISQGPWSLGGNITWSELKGNYEGEGDSTPGRGEGLQNFTTLNGVSMYDTNQVNAPYGYLNGHCPLRMRFNGSYVSNNAYGKTTLGLVYRFDAGERYSMTRTLTPEMVNANLPSQFGQSATQYQGERNAYHFEATAVLDMAVTHEFPIFKAYGKTVTGFVKLSIGNFFNHQQKVGWDVAYADAKTGMTDAWEKAPTYGAFNSSAYWVAARNYAVSTGFRF